MITFLQHASHLFLYLLGCALEATQVLQALKDLAVHICHLVLQLFHGLLLKDHNALASSRHVFQYQRVHVHLLALLLHLNKSLLQLLLLCQGVGEAGSFDKFVVSTLKS